MFVGSRHLAGIVWCSSLLALAAGCAERYETDDDDSAGGDDDDTTAAEPGFTIEGSLDTISRLTFHPDLTAEGAPDVAFLVSWDFGDGTTLGYEPLHAVEHQYLTLGNHPVTMQYQSVEPGGPSGQSSRFITIEHPDYWPRIVPTYYISGFTQDPVDDLVADPRNVRAVMVAAFDLYDVSTSTVDGALIDTLHAAGLLVYVDIAQWNEPWIFWNETREILTALVQGGIDGIDFDEFGNNGNSLAGPAFNSMRDELRAINPHIRLMVTQQFLFEIEALLDEGGEPDYFALEWYLAGSQLFDEALDLSIESHIRLAYWVDPSTYDHIQETYDDASAVLLWNLCWSPSTCGGDYPQSTWVPWDDVAPYVEDLGSGVE